MSSQQRSNFILFRQLLRQLRAFGLNPHDWHVDRSGFTASEKMAGKVHLRHRRDEDFKMRAHFEASQQGTAKLRALRVVSL